MVGFYGISTIIGYLMPNPLYIYIKYKGFGLVGFYGLSTIVSYLMLKSFYIYIEYIYMICKHLSWKTFLNKPELFFHTVK